MADIFISYSKKHAQLTVDLARDLEAEGYTTWWDTGLLPDDVFFPQTIRAEIEAARAVIVIWAEHSIKSEWVYSEAQLGRSLDKLLQVRDEALAPHSVPLPFTAGNIPPVTDRSKIFAALARRKIAPSSPHAAPEPPKAPPPRAPAPAPAPAQPSPPPPAAKAPDPVRAAPSVARTMRAMVGAGQAAREMRLAQGESFRDLDIAPEMVVIPPGEFWMGSKDGEGYDSERPRHKVTIPQAFAVGKFPVTFADWDAYAAEGGGLLGFGKRYSPSDQGWGRGRRPVINVSWDDAQAYIKWLSEKTKQPYRLLSEAEWEYACRAGTETAYSFGNSITKAQAQFSEGSWGSAGKTVEVGSFPANTFGLHDMHGNVWEWCQDCWNDTYNGAPSDGGAWTTGDCGRRALRGGSWIYDPAILRSASRRRVGTGVRVSINGFRLARTLTL